MNFASDNHYGVHPRILEGLAEANLGSAPAYGGDVWTKKAEEQLSKVFEKEVRSFLVTTGTAANGLALSALTPSYGAVICHGEAHISVDECNSPEMFTGGAKILGLHGPAGKITPAMIEKTLKGFIRGEHDPKPAAVSLTNSTELGTTYSPDDVKAISNLIKTRGMKLHMDGARFANAVAGLNVSPAELTWKSGVDVMSFGATKNGAMMLEAVVFLIRNWPMILSTAACAVASLFQRAAIWARKCWPISKAACGSKMPSWPTALPRNLPTGYASMVTFASRIRYKPTKCLLSCRAP